MAETAIQGMTDFEKQLIHAAFLKHVNLAPREIDKLVGIDPAAPVATDPVGVVPLVPPAPVELELVTEEQRIGRDLVRIRRSKREELDDADYKRMRDAVNCIRRFSERPPKNSDDAGARSAWRTALMARGFDPDRAEKTEAAVPSEK